MSGAPVIEKFLHAIESATIPGCDVWSADATLDATVPNWRLHATGADAIRAEYSRWFADPGRFHELRRSRSGTPVRRRASEVVEYTLSWQENGVPHAAHHMHLLTVRDDLHRRRHRVLRRPLAGLAARRDGGSQMPDARPWPGLIACRRDRA